jgi:Response regulator containing CheY-like receiver, AAA-type ATPase, and DNA-binding domains
MASDSDGMQGTGKSKGTDNASKERLLDLRVTSTFLLVFLVIGLIVLLFQSTEARWSALLWALAWLAIGDIIGFLFGIPRVLQQPDAKPPANPPAAGAAAPPATPPTDTDFSYRQEVNTNLEQISDWLTKIIVGIGLIELRRLPELLSRVSRFMAAGLGATQQAQVLAAGIIIYFSILGFLSGYLLTRIYLSGAFRRADTSNVLVSGIPTPISSLFEQLYKSVTEIRELITKSNGSSISTATRQATPPPTAGHKIRSVLWVDDEPGGNSLIISEMRKQQIAVTTVKSTQDALAAFQPGRYDVIISDMSRITDGPKAGIELVNLIRKMDTQTPIIIYCSKNAAEEFRDEALTAGANEITSSQTVLRNFLQLSS